MSTLYPAVPGSFIDRDSPGAVDGYFKVVSPSLLDTHVRAVALHPNLFAAIKAGTIVLKFGMLIGVDKNDPNGFKIVVGTNASQQNWEVLISDVAGGIYPSFNTSDSPDTQTTGKTSIVDASFYEVETDQFSSDSTLAVGGALTVSHHLSAGGPGLFLSGGSAGPTTSVGETVLIKASVLNADGSAYVPVVRVRVKGAAFGQ